ncbi:hypothetical protein pdam_00021784 [Pocillopora damicornis]|uniref:DnaJ-like protein C11 C-terminal domain-containing protein n=1 Tax=Pocillopora damicornis TaxID=46731 RepID=A0A3M6ULB5_POCDA|nr:hypothetical protein pdam_00021784 [Pocillopora damicornis]
MQGTPYWERRITDLANVGLIFLFYVRLTRASQVYNFPINLSEEIQPAAIFYGTVVPVAVFWVVKMLIVNPFVKMEKEMETEANKTKHARQMAEKKREAESSIQLMQETCERIIEYESSRHGLIIVNAWYGHLVSMDESTQGGNRGPSKVIDVTVPVQCQVKDSRLFLTESSKLSIFLVFHGGRKNGVKEYVSWHILLDEVLED